MNKNQKIILVVMAVVVALMLIFPPFCLETQKRTYNYGYRFILNPPGRAMINIGMLLTQWVGVLFLGSLAWFLAKYESHYRKNKSDSTSKKTELPPFVQEYLDKVEKESKKNKCA